MTIEERKDLAAVLAEAIAIALKNMGLEQKEEKEFPSGNVPVSVVAKVLGKDAQEVRALIVTGALPIGRAVRNNQVVTRIEDMDSRKGRISYLISPKRLYEETGFVWRGEKTAKEVEERVTA